MRQKNYIIGNTIRFTPANEILSLLESPETSIVLTPACNRLLKYLITNQGVVLSRDAIFSTLWEQYGSTPSNSSLNTYMSLIRKAFVNLGIEDEVITTIPKTGFLFNPDVAVEEIETDPVYNMKDDVSRERFDTSEGDISDSIPIGHNSAVVTERTEGIKSKKSRPFLLLTFSVMFFLLALIIYYFTKSDTVPPVIPVKAGQIESCNIMFLPVYTGDSVMFSDSQARFMVSQSGFTCKPGGIFYIFADKRVMASQRGKVYVSYCELKNGHAKNCTDFMGDNVKLPD